MVKVTVATIRKRCFVIILVPLLMNLTEICSVTISWTGFYISAFQGQGHSCYFQKKLCHQTSTFINEPI